MQQSSGGGSGFFGRKKEEAKALWSNAKAKGAGYRNVDNQAANGKDKPSTEAKIKPGFTTTYGSI